MELSGNPLPDNSFFILYVVLIHCNLKYSCSSLFLQSDTKHFFVVVKFIRNRQIFWIDTLYFHTLSIKNHKTAGKYQIHIYAVTKSGQYYMVNYTGIYANQLANQYTITAGDCTISVSPMSYVFEMLNSTTAQKDLKDLVCALYHYAQACKAQ